MITTKTGMENELNRLARDCEYIKLHTYSFTDAVEFSGDITTISAWYTMEQSTNGGYEWVNKITYNAHISKCAEINDPEALDKMIEELREAREIIEGLERLCKYEII